MGLNGNILEESGMAPILASGAITAKRAVVATTPDSSARQRGKQCDAVGQNADLSLVPRFLGVSPDAIADGSMGSIQRRGRCRAEGGGVITAPALVTLDSDGQFVSFTPDATKYGMVVGYAATDCGGAAQFFDLVIEPMIVGPASADGVDFTLSGELALGGHDVEKQGADIASANNLALLADGDTFEVTGAVQINLIANTNFRNGSTVTLLFTGAPTVKHAQVTAGANITVLLAGAADFVASPGDTLTLKLCEIGGTQAWREVGRAVI